MSLGAGAVGEYAIGEGPDVTATGGPPPPVYPPVEFRDVYVRRRALPPPLTRGRVTITGAARIPFRSYAQTFRDGFRAADDSLAIYELYVGEDAEPDFGSPPADTASTIAALTYTPTPPVSGVKTLYVVVRQRNKYDLSSFNVWSRTITIDSGGVEDLGPITAPASVAVYDGATGYIRVLASYTGEDDANPADTWEVYVGIGSDPTPGVSVAASTATMSFGFGVAGLNVTLGPYAAGADARVIVTAKRASDSRRGSADVVQHTLATSLDLSDADLFGGRSFT